MENLSQNRTSRSVSSTYLQAFIYGAIKMGVDKDTIMALVPGGENALINPVKRFSTDILVTALNTAIAVTGDKSISLRIGLNFRQEHFRDVGYALPYAKNLKEAHELNAAHQPLTQQIGKTTLEVADGFAKMVWTSNAKDVEREKYFTESIFAGYASIGRWLLFAQDNPIRFMRFQHAAPDDISVHQVVFGEGVEFNAPRDEMAFDESLLDVAMPLSNKKVFALLKQKLGQRLYELNESPGLATEALRLVQAGLSENEFSIATVAARLGTTERTLRRHLASEGLSFREILSTARKELCEIYFTQDQLSLAQIALTLGFQDQSAFSRAFKDWYGVSPRQYKKHQQVTAV